MRIPNTILAGGMMAAIPFLAFAQDPMPDSAPTEAPTSEAPPAELTPEQMIVYGEWSDERQAAYDAWPGDTQAYFWTLPEERQALFWRLSDNDRLALTAMDAEVRSSSWTIIEQRAAAMDTADSAPTPDTTGDTADDAAEPEAAPEDSAMPEDEPMPDPAHSEPPVG